MMSSASAIHREDSKHHAEVRVKYVPGPDGGHLDFEERHEHWFHCTSDGHIEIEIEAVLHAEFAFVAESPELFFEGFVLIPRRNHLGRKPSTEGLRVTIRDKKIAVIDHYLDSDSLGTFGYEIYYRAQTQVGLRRGRFDPEIVNRGELGEDQDDSRSSSERRRRHPRLVEGARHPRKIKR